MLSSGWATIWESMRSTGGEGEGMGGELWLSDCTRLSGVIMTTQRFTQCLAKEPSVRKGGETYADPFNCWQNRGTLRSSGFLNSVGWLGKEQSQINVNRISFFSEGSCGILGTQLSCSTYAFPFLSIFEASVTQGCLKNREDLNLFVVNGRFSWPVFVFFLYLSSVLCKNLFTD